MHATTSTSTTTSLNKIFFFRAAFKHSGKNKYKQIQNKIKKEEINNVIKI
jgi:hypothetical protein